MKRVFSLLQVLDNLSRVPRLGGVLFAGLDPNNCDSIAEHSYKVSYLCLILGQLAKKQGLKPDTAALLSSAINHDWTDCILLDLPTGSPSYKSYFQNVDFLQIVKEGEKVARKAIEDFVEGEIDLPLGKEELGEIEKKILAIADTLSLLLEILEWKYQGLKYEWFDYVWSNTLQRLEDQLGGDFKFLEPLIEELQKAFASGGKPPNPFLTRPQFQTLKR